jgi:hypothetical protein
MAYVPIGAGIDAAARRRFRGQGWQAPSPTNAPGHRDDLHCI